jgi:hypothetical protein
VLVIHRASSGVVSGLPALLAEIGDGTIVAMVVFVVVGLAAGLLSSGPGPQRFSICT